MLSDTTLFILSLSRATSYTTNQRQKKSVPNDSRMQDQFFEIILETPPNDRIINDDRQLQIYDKKFLILIKHIQYPNQIFLIESCLKIDKLTPLPPIIPLSKSRAASNNRDSIPSLDYCTLPIQNIVAEGTKVGHGAYPGRAL